jgi:hypothetical protein
VTVTFLLLAVGLVLAGGEARSRTDGSAAPDRGSGPRSRLPKPVGQGISGVAIALLCVTALGLGSGLMAAGVAVPVGVAAVAWAYDRPPRPVINPSLALALDLIAVALRSGQPLSAALMLAAPAADGVCGERLVQVGGLLRLGAEPADAWRIVADDPVLAPVAAGAVRSASSGVRLAGAFELLATDVRATLRVAAQRRAERAGVFAAAPLGLCFLPSFVCLGIVPTIVGIAHGVLGASR